MKSSPFIFGTETELAVFVESKGSIRPAPAELATAIVEDVADRYKHAPSPPPERRLFLANGSCIYNDIGGHPEIASAECTNPIDLVINNFALRSILAESAESVGRVYGIAVRLIANNVDYGFAGAQTYGYHLNILTRGLTYDRAATQLAPLFAAMPLIAGTGKVSFATGSAGFELSQRASYMTSILGKHTTSCRAIITVKDEMLTDKGVRLHLICFDTPRSRLQMALVPAIIALVLKAVEAGKDIAADVALADPIQALHKVSTDPSLSARLALKRGGTTTALEIHEYYIKIVDEFLGHKNEIPSWCRKKLNLWRKVIGNLRQDPFLETERLDWVTKLLLFTKLLGQMGLTWQDYSRWIYVLASVRRLKATWPTLDPLRLTQTECGRAKICHTALGVLDRYLASHNLSWKDFPKIWNAANRLCELCLRYHMLTDAASKPTGQWSEAELPVTKKMIEKARTLPPLGTRATVRGQAISNAKSGTITAGWTFVQQNAKRLIMNDPFGKVASWHQVKQHHIGKDQ